VSKEESYIVSGDFEDAVGPPLIMLVVDEHVDLILIRQVIQIIIGEGTGGYSLHKDTGTSEH
jgi:hypothetical protein